MSTQTTNMLQLPVAVGVDGSEEMWIVQGGTDKRVEIAVLVETIINIPNTASFVLATADPFFPSARLLEGTPGIVVLADGGPGSSITVGIAANGIGNTQLRQGAALSVIGNPTSALANVADIAAAADHQILRRSGTALGFGAIDLSQAAAVGSSILRGENGGTGVANAGRTIALGGNISTAGALTLAGAFPTTFTVTGPTSVTLPTSGTLATIANMPFVNVKDPPYLATGDGVTDDAAAINAARLALQAVGGGVLWFPKGTFIVGNDSALGFNAAGHYQVRGTGQGSIIKAKAGALLGNVVFSVNPVTSFIIQDVVLDGNKVNTGTAPGSSMLTIGNDNATVDRIVIQNCVGTGLFLSDNDKINILNSTIQDNEQQGMSNVGAPPTNVVIDNCDMARNYNTTAITDSSAINLQMFGWSITNCRFWDNYNINGGQVEVADGGTGTTALKGIFSGNKIWQTGTVVGENTFGCSFYGSDVDVLDNVIGNAARSVTGPGIVGGGDVTGLKIEGNRVYATGAGINLVTNPGATGVSKASIRNNDIYAGLVGLSFQMASPQAGVVVDGNWINPTITPFASPSNVSVYPSNYGAGTATAGALSVSTAGVVRASALVIADPTAALSRSGGGGVPIQGTNTNDSAAAGNVGQEISGSASGVVLTSSTPVNITSISLTAGDWDIQGVIVFRATTSTTNVQLLNASISTTTGAPDTTIGRFGQLDFGAGLALNNLHDNAVVTPTFRVSLSGTTTLFLVANQIFTTGTMTGSAVLRARRER